MTTVEGRIENYSPLHPITDVLVFPIGLEAVLGTCLPSEISLFEAKPNADVIKGRQDHDRMMTAFRDRGINSIDMRKVLGKKLAEKHGNNRFSDKQTLLQEITKRAELWINHYHTRDVDQVAKEVEHLLDTDIRAVGLDDALAVNAVLSRCVDYETGLEKPFGIEDGAMGNIIYSRDPMHVTGNELVVNKMAKPNRVPETDLMCIALDALEIDYRRILGDSSCHLEGGDYLPMEFGGTRYAMLGQGERTSKTGTDAWFRLHKSLFSYSGEGLIPVSVEGPTRDQQKQMHLDTHTQQVSKDAAIHCGTVTRKRTAYTLMEKGGEIVRVDGERFDRWLAKRVGNLYDMKRKDQLLYAPNILTDPARGLTYITRDGTPDVTDFIRSVVGSVVLLQLNNLTDFYGGSHCATQEFRRSI